MIKKLQTKFILLTMTALFSVLFLLIAGINIVNYRNMIQDADQLLSFLSKNEGTFPQFRKNPPKDPDHKPEDLPRDMSLETPYESRFFSVVLTKETGAVIQVETGRIASVDSEEAVSYSREILEKGKKSGSFSHFRYLCKEEGDNVRIIFLDCSSRLISTGKFLLTSVAISLAGFGIVTLIIVFFSNRIIRPISESYEKQKRFITDAGHEIKTPLTIIQADADILEMDFGENEWIEDIQKQTERLTELTQNLILLNRMEEAQTNRTKVEFPISDVIREAALSFQGPAQTQHKELVLAIEPLLSLVGDSKAIHQLANLLLDNALKYSPEESQILVSLFQKNKTIQFQVENQTVYPLSKEHLYNMFDRFYRADPSRNSSTGGYGIGLSVAKAIVASHGGKIRAISPDGTHLQIQVTFPI